MKGAELAGIDPSEFEIVNVPTNETPQVLASGAVDAIGAWQPNSGQALKTVPGSMPVLTSADAPGIIYDLLSVDPESLEARRDEWAKVVKVWYRIVDFLKTEENIDEALEILADRVDISPEEYEPFFGGTYILSLEEALEIWKEGEGLGSVYGSTVIADQFNVSQGVYEEPLNTAKYLDPSLVSGIRRFARSGIEVRSNSEIPICCLKAGRCTRLAFFLSQNKASVAVGL